MPDYPKVICVGAVRMTVASAEDEARCLADLADAEAASDAAVAVAPVMLDKKKGKTTT